jgi:hypothetical protein
LSADVGGTFTDIAAFDEATGELQLGKTPPTSTSGSPRRNAWCLRCRAAAALGGRKPDRFGRGFLHTIPAFTAIEIAGLLDDGAAA